MFLYLKTKQSYSSVFARIQLQESEKAMAPHSSTLAWKIPWTEDPCRLQSMGLRRVRHDFTFSFTFHFHALEKEMAPHYSVLAWRIPGTGEPGGLPSMGSHRVGQNWSDLAAAAAVTRIWRRKQQPTPVLLPGESHGQKSLAGYSSKGHRELDTTECQHTHIQITRMLTAAIFWK